MTDTLVVGDGNCQIKDIANILKKDTIVFKQWKQFGGELGIDEVDIAKLRQDLLLDKLTFYDIIQSIIQDWRKRLGHQATIVELVACMDTLEWFHISELLSNRFEIPYECKEKIISTKPLPRKFGVENPVDTFTGRHGELEALHEMLTSSNTDFTVITQPAAISGLGGIGKTELARQYIYVYGDNFSSILWITAESELKIQERFKSVAKDDLMIPLKDADGGDKNIFAVVEQVYRKLEGGKTFVVFDNAEIIDSFKKYLPTCQRGHLNPTILLTSRNQEWNSAFEIETISLDELKLSEATDLVRKGLKLTDNDQSDDIKHLLELLQCFPLAIQQAISYIKQNKNVDVSYSIAKYVNEFNNSKEELLNSKIPLGSNTYTQTTLTTWNLTMKKVESEQNYGTLATRIMYLIAYMAPDNISHDFFIELFETVQEQSNWVGALKGMACSFIYMGANTEPVVEKNVTEDQVRRAVGLLVKYSMVKRISDISLSIHRLVQEVTRIRINASENENHVLKEALELLSKAEATNVSTHGAAIWKNLIKHNQLVVEYQRIPLTITNALNDDHKYEEAYNYYKSTIAQLKELLPENNTQTLDFLEANARTIHETGREEEALSILKEILEKWERVLGSDHPDILTTMSNMAGVLQSQGKLDEAFSIYKEVLEKQKRVLGSDHPDILTTMSNMAGVLKSQGKLDEALSIYKEVLEKRERVQGSDHPHTLRTMNNMAVVLKSQGKLDEAFSIYNEVLEKQERVLGSDHPDILSTMNNMAGVLKSQGKLDEAFSIYNEVLEKQERVLGSDHPDTLTTMNNMAVVLKSQGKLDEAFAIYKEVSVKHKRVLGSDHPDTLTVINNMAIVLESQGNVDEALAIYKEVLEKRKRVLGSDHPDTLRTMNDMAEVFQSQGKLDEALSI